MLANGDECEMREQLPFPGCNDGGVHMVIENTGECKMREHGPFPTATTAALRYRGVRRRGSPGTVRANPDDSHTSAHECMAKGCQGYNVKTTFSNVYAMQYVDVSIETV